MADEQFENAAGRVLTALPRELFVLILGSLDAASIACLALCSKALRNAIREKIPAAQRTLRVSDFVRDPKVLAVGLATFEFPCVSLTAWAVRAGSIPTLDYLRRIGFLDAKSVCSAAIKKMDLVVLEWSLLSGVHQYWTPANCEAVARSYRSGAGLRRHDAQLLVWVIKNGCPCLWRHAIMETKMSSGAAALCHHLELARPNMAPLRPRINSVNPPRTPQPARPIPLSRPILGSRVTRPKDEMRPWPLTPPEEEDLL